MSTTTAYWQRVDEFQRIIDSLDTIARTSPDILTAYRDPDGSRRAEAQLRRLASILPLVDPDAGWSLSISGDEDLPREFMVRTMAALADPSTRHCEHVRGGAQPIAALGFRAVLCPVCVNTALDAGPDPNDDDRCDWCGRRRVRLFTPIAATGGPLLIFGNACPSCARVLLPAGHRDEMTPKGWG